MAVLDNTSAPNTPPPFWNTALRYGGFCGLTLVVFSLISYLLGISPMSFSAIAINFIIALGVTIAFAAIAIKFQRDQLDGGFISYGRALVVGIVTVGIGVIISSVWNYILVNFIDPGYVDTLKEEFMETWGENMPADAIEKTMENFDKMGDISTIATNGVIGGLILGLIAGLIAAAFMKRDRPLE
ncbi:MAG: DUF4199 family protein [Lewinellaceae bacterium]|nr:DUF4199 family protein [Lewinellaceae bacterium]